MIFAIISNEKKLDSEGQNKKYDVLIRFAPDNFEPLNQ